MSVSAKSCQVNDFYTCIKSTSHEIEAEFSRSILAIDPEQLISGKWTYGVLHNLY